ASAELLEHERERAWPHLQVERRAFGQERSGVSPGCACRWRGAHHHRGRECEARRQLHEAGSAAARALSSSLSNLPVGLRGRAAPKTKRRGHLKLARVARTCWASSPSLERAPGLSTTNATSFSPHSGSGTPTTAVSATAGCWCRRCSISSG